MLQARKAQERALCLHQSVFFPISELSAFDPAFKPFFKKVFAPIFTPPLSYIFEQSSTTLFFSSNWVSIFFLIIIFSSVLRRIIFHLFFGRIVLIRLIVTFDGKFRLVTLS